MEAHLYGNVSERAIVVVSTWDPLLPQARSFLQRLIDYARTHNGSAVAVVLDPAPQRFLRGVANWPVYTSFDARVRFLLAQGVDGVLRIDFKQEDLKLGVYELLDVVRTRIPVAEVWMRPQQTFGPNSRGSAMALALYAKRHGLAWKRPVTPDTKPLVAAVHQHLRRGEIEAARAIVGLPPIWSRPDYGEFETAWRAGRYIVGSGIAGGDGKADQISVHLREDPDGLSRMNWPAPGIDHLTVINGPGDAVPQVETATRREHEAAVA